MRRFFNSITRPERRPELCLGLFLAAIGLTRLTLLGSGACSLGDEFRYWYTAQMLLAASHGDLAAALSPMFDTAGRPGLAIAQLPPVITQSIVYKITGLDPRCPASLLIPQAWNVAVSLAGAWLFFRVGRRAFGFSSERSAWLTVAFSFLTSSSIYVRHLLPYDFALCIFLWVLLLTAENKKPFWIGLATAFAYSVYPGFFPLCGASFLIFLFKSVGRPLSFGNFLKTTIPHTSGFFALLIFCEILSRISGKSFIENSLSGGREFLHFLNLPYDGSSSFLLDYLWSVEGVAGLLLAAGAVFFFLKLGLKIARRQPLGLLDWLAVGLLAAFLFQTAVGLATGMKVFYGRLLRPFAMAMVWLAGAAFFSFLEKTGRPVFLKKLLVAVVMGCFFIHFALFWKEYRQIGYPRDLFADFHLAQKADGLGYDIRSSTRPADGLRRVEQFAATSFFNLPPQSPWQLTAPADSSLLFLNFATVPAPSPPPFERENPRAADFDTLVLKRHFAGFAPYFFEEDPGGRRRFLAGRPLEIGVLGEKKMPGR